MCGTAVKKMHNIIYRVGIFWTKVENQNLLIEPRATAQGSKCALGHMKER